MADVVYKDSRQRRYTPEEQEAIMARWKASGLAKTHFCKEQGLSPSTLSQWLHQAAGVVESGSVELSAVRIIDKKGRLVKEEAAPTVVEVCLPSQVVLRCRSPIKELVVFIVELTHATATVR